MFVFMLIVCGLGFIALGITQGEWVAIVVGLAILAPLVLIKLGSTPRQLSKEELIERFTDKHDR